MNAWFVRFGRSSGARRCAFLRNASASRSTGAALVWLIVFAAGFRAALGLSIIPPYETYITYESISCRTVRHDSAFQRYALPRCPSSRREMGSCGFCDSLAALVAAISKLVAGCMISILQVYVFLAIAAATGIVLPGAAICSCFPPRRSG